MVVEVPVRISSTLSLQESENIVRLMKTTLLDMDINQTNPDFSRVLAQGASSGVKKWAFPGHLVVTNKRLLFVEQVMGFWGPKDEHKLRDVIDLESIRGTSVYQKFPGGLRFSVTYLADSSSRERGFKEKDAELLHDLKTQVDGLVRARTKEIEEQKRRARVQFVMDFSFLKAQFEKGGLSVNAVKCPSCSANIAVPGAGAFFKCEHCGTTIHAIDIFERFRGLLQGP